MSVESRTTQQIDRSVLLFPKPVFKLEIFYRCLIAFYLFHVARKCNNIACMCETEKKKLGFELNILPWVSGFVFAFKSLFLKRTFVFCVAGSFSNQDFA